MNLPNKLTVFRIFLIPVFMILLIAQWPAGSFTLAGTEILWSRVVAMIVFAVASATDWFDGYLARRWQQTSSFGAFLDPVADKLMVVIPCYNEEEVLPETSRRLVEKMAELTRKGLISPESRVLLVDDGSRDRTWELIEGLHAADPLFGGLRLSRNRGHQNALLAGLFSARGDAIVSIENMSFFAVPVISPTNCTGVTR